MVSLVINTQSLWLQWIWWYGVAAFLSSRYWNLDIWPDSSNTTQSAGSWLGRWRPIGSIQL